MTTDWILRVGDGFNFIRSSDHKIWGIQSSTSCNKGFLKNVKPGDRLWFVLRKSRGQILGVATYASHNERLFGPCISTLTNEELGWTGCGPDWTSDTEIHYKNLIWLNTNDLYTNIKGAVTIRKYNEKCKVNLPSVYDGIRHTLEETKYTL